MDSNIKKKLSIIIGTFCLISCFCFIFVYSVYTENTAQNSKLKFQVPEDWPIEERGGLIGPIPTEEYVARKFKEVETEFSSIKVSFDEDIKNIKNSLESVEANLTKEIKQAQSNMGEQDGALAPVGNNAVMERMAEIESQIARIDRKITNKVLEVEGVASGVENKLDRIEKKLKKLQTAILKVDEKANHALKTNKN